MPTLASRLTRKQERFAEIVADGAPYSMAYREAYEAQAMQSSTVWAEASRMARHRKVSARIEAIKAEKEAIQGMQRLRTAEGIVEQLQTLAATAPSDQARIRALELLGKHLGIFRPMQAPPPPQIDADELAKRIVRKLDALKDYL